MEERSVDQTDTDSYFDSTTDIGNYDCVNFSTEQEHEYRMICKRVQESMTRNKQLTMQYMEITKQKQLEIEILKLKLQKKHCYDEF